MTFDDIASFVMWLETCTKPKSRQVQWTGWDIHVTPCCVVQWATSPLPQTPGREMLWKQRNPTQSSHVFPLPVTVEKTSTTKTACISHLTSKGIASYLLFTATCPSDRAPPSPWAEAVGGVQFLPSKSLPFQIAQHSCTWLLQPQTNRLLVLHNPSRQAKCLC